MTIHSGFYHSMVMFHSYVSHYQRVVEMENPYKVGPPRYKLVYNPH